MKIDILTLFPDMFKGPFSESIVKRAQEDKVVEIELHNLRQWTTDKHRSVDAPPFGGGPGMVMRVDIIDRAIKQLKTENCKLKTKVILLDTKGKIFNQQKAKTLAELKHLILICGHYEGIDHRVHDQIADEVISIGQYVLSGGEIPAMVIVDSLVRLLPGVLGNPQSLKEESYSNSKIENSKIENLLEYPQYTRPAVYRGWKVPEILLSGNHPEIEKWRKGEINQSAVL